MKDIKKKMSKKNRKWSDLTKKEQEEAKESYMAYQSIQSIASKLNVARTTVSYHASKYWDVEREMNRVELYNQFSKTKKAHFVNMSENAIKIITKSLQYLAERSEPPSTKEAKEATVILESLDKITRLDEGKPTEISEEKVMNLSDIADIASLVPFNSKNKKSKEEGEEKEKEDVKKNQ